MPCVAFHRRNKVAEQQVTSAAITLAQLLFISPRNNNKLFKQTEKNSLLS